MIVYGKLDGNGKLSKTKAAILKQFMLDHKWKNMVIEVKEAKSPTQKQFGYLYGVLYSAIQTLEFQQNEVHMMPEEIDYEMKMMFWHEEVVPIGGGLPRKRPITKQRMNREELSIYLTQVKQFIETHYGVYIDEPTTDEYDYDKTHLAEQGKLELA